MKAQIKKALKENGFRKGTLVPDAAIRDICLAVAGDDSRTVGKFWTEFGKMATRDSLAQDCVWTIR